MPEYTLFTVVAVIMLILAELLWARTGIFASWRYWTSIAIVFVFQMLVDGWLTRLPNPVVAYAPAQFSGIRVFGSIPIEDFGFGFVMVTMTVIIWLRAAPVTSARQQHEGSKREDASN